MSNLFITTAIGYETRGASEDPASAGMAISRVQMAVRWDVVTAISAIEHPAICFDNDDVTEPISQLTTKHGSYHICCSFPEAVRQWQAWEAGMNAYRLTSN